MFPEDVCLYKVQLICSLLPYFEGSPSPLLLHEWEQCHLKTCQLVLGFPDVWSDAEFPLFSQQLYFLHAQQINHRCIEFLCSLSRIWVHRKGLVCTGTARLRLVHCPYNACVG